MMGRMRIAAYDIGSNSVRCTIVDAPADGPRTTLDDEKAYTRLGAGLAETGRLSDDAVEATVAALQRMQRIAQGYSPTHVRAVATAAVRSAANGGELVTRIREELGLEVEVVSAEEEGRLAFLSALEGVGLEGRSAVADLGGGSLEIVRASGAHVEHIVSLPLGAVVMTERYLTDGPASEKDLKRLRKHVGRTLVDALGEEPSPVATLVGSGGTANTIAALVAARRDPGLASLHGYVVRRAELIHLAAELARGTTAQRAAMKGMPANRADIIVAGTIVIDEVMRAFGANELVLNARGMREGVVIDTIERERGASARSDRMQAAREFARRCNADEPHAEQVREFSLALFDALADSLGLDGDARPLLEAAALMHDVGYHVAYEDHHKHSHHLITHARLRGFSGRHLRLIAAIARYHRGALPKPSHEALLNLGEEDRALVSTLGALLRLADGLDRTRGQRIERLDVVVDPTCITVTISGAGPLEVEVYGAQRKTDLLERVSARRVDVADAG